MVVKNILLPAYNKASYFAMENRNAESSRFVVRICWGFFVWVVVLWGCFVLFVCWLFYLVWFFGGFFAVTCMSVTAFNLCLKFATVYCPHWVEGISGNFCNVQVRMLEFLSHLLKASERKLVLFVGNCFGFFYIVCYLGKVAVLIFVLCIQ